MRRLLLTLLVGATAAQADLETITVSPDGSHFVRAVSHTRFRVWGLNYDHDRSGRLLEEYWYEEWPTVAEDFEEMKTLGANVVRIHLQVEAFMDSADKPRQAALDQLARLVSLAEQTGLYLDLTGLGCYHKQDVPAWYDAAGESKRWAVQARFWEAVAKTCAASPAIFCYDLMNEPILPGKKTETEWLAGEFAGKYFVQRIALDLAGRTREGVAKAWVDMLVGAIRRQDAHHLITVGAIPWAHHFPKAKPIFYGNDVGANLDFVSVHFYPKSGAIDQALAALSLYKLKRPLVIEEIFPLKCSMAELDAFIAASRDTVDGYISFYWGQTIEEFREEKQDMAGARTKAWLEYFRTHAPAMSP